jgi:hypothetical protein
VLSVEGAGEPLDVDAFVEAVPPAVPAELLPDVEALDDEPDPLLAPALPLPAPPPEPPPPPCANAMLDAKTIVLTAMIVSALI